MQRHRKGDGEQTGRVARDPVRHGRGRGKRPARRKTQTPVPFDVGVVREQGRSEPSCASDERCDGDVQSACVEAVSAVRERDGHDEPDAPRRDGEELGVDRRVP